MGVDTKNGIESSEIAGTESSPSASSTCGAARSGAAEARIEVLAIVVPEARELGCTLTAALKPVEKVNLTASQLSSDGFARGTLASDLGKFRPDLLLLCLNPEVIADSKAIFEAVNQHNAELSILAILETGGPDELQRVVQMGAVDFCLAPLRLDDLLPRIMRWSSQNSKSNVMARKLEKRLGLHHFLGESRVFIEAINQIPKLAACDANVFITGETGTGKEMCARAIHHLGPRADHPFVPVNCGAIPSELVENELFGHDAGAFTGACSSIHGLVNDAEGGTLFLDEIDSLPLQVQVKLLRFLDDREYRPLGSRKSRRADVRIIAACNADLEAGVRSNRFRSDLFYRLNVLPLKLPSLRERREDIPLLGRHFAAKYAHKFSMPVKAFSRSSLEKLFAYDWPGNVRELENIIERAVVLSDRTLITGDDICLLAEPVCAEQTSFKELKARVIEEFESGYIRRLLATNEGNISKAARVAKKNRRAFFQLMRKHRIEAPAGLSDL